VAQNEEFFNFEEALDQLRLKEEELKRLVSEGEIRAFREGDTMRLRRSDVESLKTELMGGEVVELGGVDEELVFEDDVDLDDAGMATEEIADMDTLLEDDVEDVGELELDDVVEEATEPAPSPAVGAAPIAKRRGASTVGSAAKEEESEGMGMRAVLILTAAVLVLGLSVVISISSGSASGIAKMIAGLFGNDF